jgi:predicted nuclease with TOPRIM domain
MEELTRLSEKIEKLLSRLSTLENENRDLRHALQAEQQKNQAVSDKVNELLQKMEDTNID